MGGGCLPLLIQFPVMIGLYQVNYHPFSMVLRIPTAVVTGLKDAAAAIVGGSTTSNQMRLELYALENWNKIDKASINGLTPELISKIELFMQKFTFFTLDLSVVPSIKEFSVYWAIPIVSGIIALAMSIYSLVRQKKLNPEMSKNPSMGCMMLLTPAMQVYFAFLFPISVGIYIIMSTIISFIQMVVLNHVYAPKKVLAKVMIDETIYRRSRENNIKKIHEMKQD